MVTPPLVVVRTHGHGQLIWQNQNPPKARQKETPLKANDNCQIITAREKDNLTHTPHLLLAFPYSSITW